jgi:alpha-tubulin suppressor-like RCC1 family protein
MNMFVSPVLASCAYFRIWAMRLLRTSLPVVLRKLLIAGPGLCAAGAVLVIAAGAAQGSPGGTIEHWGDTGDGELYAPVALSLPGPVAEVGSSNSTEYALLANGTLYAWGAGTDGQLGNGGTANSPERPVQVKFPAGVRIASIPADVMPANSAFAVDTTGDVWAWGSNASGSFCLGNKKEYTTPVRLPFADVSALAGGGDHATYDAGGTLYSCGGNEYGQLGDGSKQPSTTPVRVAGLDGQQVTSLVASWGDTGAVLSDGEYYDWGYDGAGQLGDGRIGASSDVPVRVPLPGPVTQAAEGGSLASNGQTLVLLSDRSVYAWGSDAFYQLGDGRTASEDLPEKILPPAGVTYRTLATGGNTSYAISTAGNVYAWGNSLVGQVGDGLSTPAKQPVMVLSGATTISSTAANVVVSVGLAPVSPPARAAGPA